MKQILFFVAIATLVIACGSAGDNANSNKADKSSDSKAIAEKKIDGEKVYKTYCIACHGLYGDMAASGAYNLKVSELSIEERVAVITNGRNAMTAFEALLDKDEIQAVAEYTMNLAKK